MQKSWRQDSDKLTFIVCLPITPAPSTPATPPSQSRKSVKSQEYDDSDRMIGDVNLFITEPITIEEEEKGICVGELELMIAVPSARRKGRGRATIVAFLLYISSHIQTILSEYSSPQTQSESLDPEKRRKRWEGLQLRVKIGGENEKSLKLFESLGFRKVSDTVSYFGEWELWFDGLLGMNGNGEERIAELHRRFGGEEYEEMRYD